MAFSGSAELEFEKKRQLFVPKVVRSVVQLGPGIIFPKGRNYAVTAFHINSDTGNLFYILNGNGVIGGDDIYNVVLLGADHFSKSFKHPLIIDGLTLRWGVAIGNNRIALSYMEME